MRIGRGSGIQKCPICMRKKQEAIDEQVKNDKPCEASKCPLRDEISKAITDNRNKPKFTFEKPKFTFGKSGKRKSSFSFGKK